jgi:hypothetical protein
VCGGNGVDSFHAVMIAMVSLLTGIPDAVSTRFIQLLGHDAI